MMQVLAIFIPVIIAIFLPFLFKKIRAIHTGWFVLLVPTCITRLLYFLCQNNDEWKYSYIHIRVDSVTQYFIHFLFRWIEYTLFHFNHGNWLLSRSLLDFLFGQDKRTAS